MKVLKFGGTSVGSAAAIVAIAKIVAQENNPIVVCSAMSGVTNQLLHLAQEAATGHLNEEQIEALLEQHLATMQELVPPKYQTAIILELKLVFQQLHHVLDGISKVKELTEKTLAYVLAFGEQFSCKIINAYFNALGYKSEYVNATELIVTDSQYTNAKVLEAFTKPKIISWYQQAKATIQVVTGFIAANEDGIITNLGRGGSDYTVAIIGNAIGCEIIEIWTDVDGFYTSDPRMVRNAYSLPQLSYNEAMELSYFGAKVIYAPTMLPAIQAQIPIIIKNTFNPTHEGTKISAQTQDSKTAIKGIASINAISLVNIEGSGMVGLKGFSARFFSALSHAAVNVILITQASSEHSITIGIAPNDVTTALDAINEEFQYEISVGRIETPTAQNDLSIIAAVGSNMKNAKGVSGKFFSALGNNGINIVAIAQGSSELNISVVIQKQHLKRALNVVHDGLMLSHLKTMHLFISGIGQVGTELLQQIRAASQRLQSKHHLYLKVVAIANSKQLVWNTDAGIDLTQYKDVFKENAQVANMEAMVQLIGDAELPNCIFIDNSASADVAKYYESIMQHGASIVTCNKIANSGSYERYQKLKQTAQANGVSFLYETNVGAGLPIIKTLQDLVISGDEMIKIEAILSGTISYIFNNYKGEVSFKDIVEQAQNLGYTEPDPRDDLNGLDFARKVLILSREIGLPLEMEQIKIDKMLPDACFKAPDTKTFYELLPNYIQDLEALKIKAIQENKALRYIATIEQNKASIQLALVDASHPFYSLSGSDNIISFQTERYRNNPLVVKGPGAGIGVTAAGVFADIIKVASK